MTLPSTDHRHGSRAGYLAGCRDDCCRVPNIRYQKRSRVRRELEGLQTVSSHRLIARALWWNQRGVSAQGITDAAGLGYGTLAEAMSGDRAVCLKSTEAAILAVTWDTLHPRSLCNADLTRLRIYSLMAAGHPLAWIAAEVGDGLPISGRWRQQARVTVATARSVMAVYAAAPLDGPSAQTRAKARNRGHQHPLAWDDPGVPAMPTGWSPYLDVEVA